ATPTHRAAAATPHRATPRHGPAMLRATPDSLPEGGAREIAARACLLCHSATLLTQQHKDSTGWEKSIAQMEKWGAPLAPGEHDSLRAYLLARFGPLAR